MDLIEPLYPARCAGKWTKVLLKSGRDLRERKRQTAAVFDEVRAA